MQIPRLGLEEWGELSEVFRLESKSRKAPKPDTVGSSVETWGWEKMVELGRHNPELKRLRRLLASRRSREEEGAFVVEGPKLIGEALEAGILLEAVYLRRGALTESRFGELLSGLNKQGVAMYEVPEAAMVGREGARTPPPMVAVAKTPSRPRPPWRSLGLGIAALGIADPANAAGLLRLAWATGAGAAFVDGVDLYSPKVVRGSAGALFRVAVEAKLELDALVGELRQEGLRIIASAPRAEHAFWEEDLRAPFVLLVGSEAHGLSPQAYGAADAVVGVPMPGGAESLNVVVAAAVVCYEALRQRTLRSLP